MLPPPSSPRNGYPTAFCDRVPSLQLELCCWDSIPDIDQQPPPPSSVPPIPPADELVPINAQVCIHNVSSAKTLRDQDYVWPSIGPFLIKYCMHYSTLICRLFFVQLFCLAGDQLDHRHCVVLHLFLFLSRPSWHHELVRADVEDEEGGDPGVGCPGAGHAVHPLPWRTPPLLWAPGHVPGSAAPPSAYCRPLPPLSPLVMISAPTCSAPA